MLRNPCMTGSLPSRIADVLVKWRGSKLAHGFLGACMAFVVAAIPPEVCQSLDFGSFKWVAGWSLSGQG